MITSYTRDAKNALKSESGAYISESGKYRCQITQCALFESQSGWQSVRLNLLDWDTKATATISLFLFDPTGKEHYQKAMFDAILTCMGVDNITFVPGKIQTYSGEANGVYCPEINKKYCGFLLRKVLRSRIDRDAGTDENGMPFFKDYTDLQMVCAFNPKTELTASEIVNGKTEAKSLSDRISRLTDGDTRQKDREYELKRSGASAPSPTSNSASYAAATSDVPF